MRSGCKVVVVRPASAGSTEQVVAAADTNTDTAAATHHRRCFKDTVDIKSAGFAAGKVAHHSTVHHADHTIVTACIVDAQTAAGSTRVVVHHGDFFHTEVDPVIARSGEMSIFKPDLCINGTAGDIGTVAVEKQILEYQIHGGEDSAARSHPHCQCTAASAGRVVHKNRIRQRTVTGKPDNSTAVVTSAAVAFKIQIACIHRGGIRSLIQSSAAVGSIVVNKTEIVINSICRTAHIKGTARTVAPVVNEIRILDFHIQSGSDGVTIIFIPFHDQILV